MNIRTDKQSVGKFLKKTNNDITNAINQMKSDLQKNPCSVTNIKQRLLGWKIHFDQAVMQNIKQFIAVGDFDQKQFDFKQYLLKVTDQYGNDQQFLQMLKMLNYTVQSLKQIIRSQLMKDPSIYYTKDI